MYIGHNTSALNRTPAQSSAMGYISSSDNSKYHPTSSVYAAVTQAAASRSKGLTPLAVLCRNPSSESEFEKRTLRKLLCSEGGSGSGGGAGGGSSSPRNENIDC